MHESEESTAKSWSTKEQYFVYERRKISCGVLGHWKNAGRKVDRDWL